MRLLRKPLPMFASGLPLCKSRHGQQPVLRNTLLSEAEKNRGDFLCLSTVQSANCSVGTKIRFGSCDGRDDGDGVSDTATATSNIVTTVTIVTPPKLQAIS